jgi:hypothetical protein
VVHRVAGSAPASSEGVVLAGNIYKSPASTNGPTCASGWLMSRASSEGIVLAGNISHPPGQMVPLVLVGGLCHPLVEMDTIT